MLTTRQSILITGSSDVMVGDEKVFVASLSATINGTDINISKTISNRDVFEANKEEVQKDFADFENYVYDYKQ